MYKRQTLTVLDHEPEQLLAVSGISKTKLKKICDSYLASRGARDVVAFLAPHGVTPNRAVKLYKQYGEHTMDIVRNHPYRLCEMVGIGFKTADRIAVSMGFDPLSPERVDEGLIFTLTDAELKGHLCMEKHSFLKQCLKLLDTEDLTEEMLAVRASRMLESGRLASYDRQVYRAVTARTEQSLAWAVYRMLTYEKAGSHVNIDTEISAEEKKQGIQLASEQRHAVTTALTSQLSVITGGPGTGKTLIQRFLLDIYRRKNRGAKIICCAPTGRAARRMEQSTGFPATTIHKALGLLAGEDGDYCEPEMLDADLIVVDEVSMMDIYLANHLFRSVPHGSQLVLIGDADQLPSVGPGAVLSEIIACGAVPVVRLDRIFRQSYGSRIAANAKLIRHGKFRWVSGTGRTDGCKAEGWVHIAGEPRAMVLLTEGPMKADVIHYLTGQTVLAVAGVNTLTQLELILPQLHEQGVERIMTAFDMDFMENPHVQGGYRTLVSLLSDAGFRYGTYLWDPRYKGLDDYVWEHCFQRQLS